MMKVHQVHAVGYATEGVGPERDSWSGDCDLPAGRIQFVDQVEVGTGGSAQSLAVIVVGEHVWARVQGADGSWTAWKSVDQVEEFYYVLNFMVPQVCPQVLAKELRTYPAHLFRIVTKEMTAKSPIWHLRGREKGKRQTYTVNAYVNQESHVWSRIAVKSVERDQAASFSGDTQYSAINEPVNIEAPMAVSGDTRDTLQLELHKEYRVVNPLQ